MKVFRVSHFLVLERELSLGLPVLLLRVFHLLVDGLTLVRVRVRGGGHRGDGVGGGGLAVSGEHLAHHFYIDGFVIPVSSLQLRVCCLERHGFGRRRHTWRKRVKGKLSAGTSLGLQRRHLLGSNISRVRLFHGCWKGKRCSSKTKVIESPSSSSSFKFLTIFLL